MIERANGCSEVATHERLLRRGCAAARKAMFDEIRTLYEAGSPVTEIARKLGLGPGGLSMGVDLLRARMMPVKG